MNNRQKAYEIARNGFDEAIKDLEMDKNFDVKNISKDSTVLLKLIKDNITLWAEKGTDAFEGYERKY